MGNYRILIIDDDDDARKLIGMMLKPRYEVVEARDGLDALSKLETYEPDFAIIDIMMPMMDGYQVCEAIRRHPRFKTMQVMFLSAYGSKENIKKSYAVGANLFMTKPVDPERILKNIDFTIVHEPPPVRTKRFTIEQLQALENSSTLKQQEARDSLERSERSDREWRPREDSIFDDLPPRPAAPPPTPANHAPDTSAPRTRLLIVDDDRELLQMLDLALRDEYEITTASNGLDAIERMVDYQPDLMLLDIMMPRMNGYQLLQSIRHNAYFGTMPVLVLSAKSSPKDQEYAMRMGANQVMGKPFHIEDLLTTLRTMTTAPGFRIRPKRLTIYEIRTRTLSQQKW